MADVRNDVLEAAGEVGVDLAGIAPLAPPPARARLRTWIARGLHAGLAYMERNEERIADPRRLLPGGESLLMVGLVHARAPVELPGGGRVARYAAGRDYHNVLGKKLVRLRKRLVARGVVRASRQVVDAGPLMERSHAAAAGLGFESKAANLLHYRHGPWFFLGGVALDVGLEPTGARAPGSCGTCRACIDACPTAALLEPGVLDAARCISYHTIENRGASPPELRAAFGDWFFGCDVCSEVCPFGRRAKDTSAVFGTHTAVAEGALARFLRAPSEGHRERLEGSPLARPGRDGLARNAAIVLGNRPSDEGRAALIGALEDPAPVVREAAAWALARGHAGDRDTAPALDRAERRAGPAERETLRASRAAAERP